MQEQLTLVQEVDGYKDVMSDKDGLLSTISTL